MNRWSPAWPGAAAPQREGYWNFQEGTDSFWESRGGWGRQRRKEEEENGRVGKQRCEGSWAVGQPTWTARAGLSRWSPPCPCGSWHSRCGNPSCHISAPQTLDCSKWLYLSLLCFARLREVQTSHLCYAHGSRSLDEEAAGLPAEARALGSGLRARGCHALTLWQERELITPGSWVPQLTSWAHFLAWLLRPPSLWPELTFWLHGASIWNLHFELLALGRHSELALALFLLIILVIFKCTI